MTILNFAEQEIGLLFLALLFLTMAIFGGLAYWALCLNKRRYASKFGGNLRVDQNTSGKKFVPVVDNIGGDRPASLGGVDIAYSVDVSDHIEKSQPIDNIKTEAEDYSKMLAKFAAGNLGDFMLPKPQSRKSILPLKKI